MILKHKRNYGDQNYIDPQDRIEINVKFAWFPKWIGDNFDTRHDKIYLIWLEDYLVVTDKNQPDGQYYL